MENYLWLAAIVGGAAILGGALAFGMFKEHPRRTTFALAGMVLVVIAAVGVSFLVSGLTNTAPSNPSTPQGTQYDTPARPSDQNALPGLNQPNR